ncbi:MAG: hypothetical protein M1825_000166 [Sarcosagium campestre]|nr:MAG: hypothetical protein M1825_000166 [Sarcosagium campestre]
MSSAGHFPSAFAPVTHPEQPWLVQAPSLGHQPALARSDRLTAAGIEHERSLVTDRRMSSSRMAPNAYPPATAGTPTRLERHGLFSNSLPALDTSFRSAQVDLPMTSSGLEQHLAAAFPSPYPGWMAGSAQESSHLDSRHSAEYIAGHSRNFVEPGSSVSSPPSRSWTSHVQRSSLDLGSSLSMTPGDSPTSIDYPTEPGSYHGMSAKGKGQGKGQRRPSNRDEFDGPHQLLDMPLPEVIAVQSQELPRLPTTLYVQEQDDVLSQVNDRLSQCAFDFVAKYQFPIPLEADKRPVRIAADREWTEWVFLLKRLATKRRIPARVLYNGQIKQLITTLENSLELRHAAMHQSRPIKDDRNVLQLVSAGIQVAKLLKDAAAMAFLDNLYTRTERVIQSRKTI